MISSSDHSIQADSRIPPQRQAAPYTYEEADLPPQTANPHYHNSGYRPIPNQPGKKNPRTRPTDDNHLSRRTSSTTQHSNFNNDGTISQISNQRSNYGPVDIQNRPLWNYNNPEHRTYVPNSKRDPHYEKRQRLKHFEQGNFDRIDDVQKRTCYNRWNSDSELQQQKKQVSNNRIRSTMSKGTSYGNHKDESIMNLLKMQNKIQQQDPFTARKSVLNHMRTDDDYNTNHESAFDGYDNDIPYTQTDEIHQPSKPYSRETSPQKETIEVWGSFLFLIVRLFYF